MKDIVAFSAVKAFYDSEKDLLDIVCGFVLYEIGEKVYNTETLKISIQKEFNLDIPLDIIYSSLKRLKNKHGFIECAGGYSRVVLTSVGIEEQKNNRAVVDRTRKQYNELLQNIKDFVKNKNGNVISLESTRELLKNTIIDIPSDTFKFAFPDTASMQTHTKSLSIIGEYILEQEKNNSSNFEVLKSIIYGNILASALESGKIENGGKLDKLNIYLDSNIIFSLFQLDDDLNNNTAVEMLRVLKAFGVNIKIFPFTLDEVKIKLLSYSGKYNTYIPDIEVDSIYFRIKQKGFKETDVLLLINNLENSLKKFSITVDYYASNVELTDFDKKLIPELTQRKEHRFLGSDNKNKQNHKHLATIEHDLLAIRAIRGIRNETFNRIELSKAIFLTANISLAKFDYEKYNHSEKRTIPEVFLRTQLVNFLWFKNPEVSSLLPIRDLMSGYIRTKMISDKLWDTFIWELKKQVEQNTYTREDIAILVSLGETKNILSEIQESNQDYSENIKKKIIDSGLIEKAKKMREESIRLKKYKKETENILEERNKQVELGNQTLMKIEKNIEKSCLSFWNRTIDYFIYFIFFIIMIFFVYIFLHFKNDLGRVVDNIIRIFSLIVFLMFFVILCISLLKKKQIITIPLFLKWRRDLENMLIQKCIKEKKKTYLDR